MNTCYERVTNLIPSPVDNYTGAWWFVILQICYKKEQSPPAVNSCSWRGTKHRSGRISPDTKIRLIRAPISLFSGIRGSNSRK